MEKQIFAGLRVLDFSNNIAGPCCSALLGDLGAEVIKIERPVTGDDIRSISPRVEGQSLQYIWANRGKKSVVLDMKDEEAQAIVMKMIAEADVIVESFKPGTMGHFGMDYASVEKVNPRIIYCSISACGQTGAYSSKPGFDIIAQGMSGLMDLTGDADGAPVKYGVTIGDYVGSLNAFGAIAAALYYREKTGEGQFIDISLMNGLIYCNTPAENAATLEAHPTRSGRHHGTMAPYGIYCGKNGQSVVIAAYTASMWSRFCKAMDKPELADDPRFNTVPLRVKNLKELVATVEEWLGKFDDINDAIKKMEANNVACCKIRSTYEVTHDKNLWDNGTFVEIPTQPSFKELKVVKARGPVARFSKTPMVVKRASDLGEYNDEILTQYGWSKEKVAEMETKWVEEVRNKKKKK